MNIAYLREWSISRNVWKYFGNEQVKAISMKLTTSSRDEFDMFELHALKLSSASKLTLSP